VLGNRVLACGGGGTGGPVTDGRLSEASRELRRASRRMEEAARKMDDGTKQMTVHIIEKQAPGLGNEWLQLTQPRGPMTRLSWSRFRSRRAQ